MMPAHAPPRFPGKRAEPAGVHVHLALDHQLLTHK